MSVTIADVAPASISRPAPRPLIAIIGPSGAGKSTVVRALHDRGIIDVVPTWTTRPCRPDEPGASLEHRFVSDDRFDELVRERFFVDTVTMFGLPYRYGLPARWEESSAPIAVVMVRAPLVERLRAHVALSSVFQIEAAPRRIRARLLGRGTPPDDVAARLADNERERALGRTVADRIFVNNAALADIVERVAAAMNSEVTL